MNELIAPSRSQGQTANAAACAALDTVLERDDIVIRYAVLSTTDSNSKCTENRGQVNTKRTGPDISYQRLPYLFRAFFLKYRQPFEGLFSFVYFLRNLFRE